MAVRNRKMVCPCDVHCRRTIAHCLRRHCSSPFDRLTPRHHTQPNSSRHAVAARLSLPISPRCRCSPKTAYQRRCLARHFPAARCFPSFSRHAAMIYALLRRLYAPPCLIESTSRRTIICQRTLMPRRAVFHAGSNACREAVSTILFSRRVQRGAAAKRGSDHDKTPSIRCCRRDVVAYHEAF